MTNHKYEAGCPGVIGGWQGSFMTPVVRFPLEVSYVAVRVTRARENQPKLHNSRALAIDF